MCPQCGYRVDQSEANETTIRQAGWVMQAVGGLVSVIGIGVLLLLSRPEVNADETGVVWRVGLLFVFLGIVVCLLGWLAPRLWSR